MKERLRERQRKETSSGDKLKYPRTPRIPTRQKKKEKKISLPSTPLHQSYRENTHRLLHHPF